MLLATLLLSLTAAGAEPAPLPPSDWGPHEPWVGLHRREIEQALGLPDRVKSRRDGVQVLVYTIWRIADVNAKPRSATESLTYDRGAYDAGKGAEISGLGSVTMVTVEPSHEVFKVKFYLDGEGYVTRAKWNTKNPPIAPPPPPDAP